MMNDFKPTYPNTKNTPVAPTSTEQSPSNYEIASPAIATTDTSEDSPNLVKPPAPSKSHPDTPKPQ